MAAHFFTRRLRRRDERGAAMQAVGQQQRPRGQLGQQLQGQRPFRLAAPTDGRRQRMVQAQFEQDAGGDFGEGRAARRVLALRVVALTCGVLVRLNWVPSSATSRQPRQKASGWATASARGRKPNRSNSAKTSQGRRVRRSLNELSAKGASKSWVKCSARVPAAFVK